jgi:uncharacterized protein
LLHYSTNLGWAGTELGSDEVSGGWDAKDDMPMKPSDAIEIKRVRGKGRGVFARRPIEEGEVIETCPMLVLAPGAIEDFSTGLGAYVFEWSRGKLALALGYGSLYNHSYRPNARYADLAGQTKLFTAIRDIAAGEEITVNYNGEPEDQTPVGFDVVECPSVSRRSKLIHAAG